MKQHTKLCRTCGKDKANRLFSAHRNVCKKCITAVAKVWREQNRDKARAHAKNYYLRGRIFLLEYLTTHPCVKCGETNPILLDFDHIDPKTKHYSPSSRCSLRPKLLEKEIAKCQILCVGCHRLKTVNDLGWYKEECLQKILAPWLT